MKTSDFWVMWKAISTSVGIIVIPITVACIANQYAKSLKTGELQIQYLALAVKILGQQPSEQNSDIREWAVSLINENSTIPLPGSTWKALVATTTLPPTTVSDVNSETFGRNAHELDVIKSALRNFLKILERQPVSLEALDSTLREIAEKYKDLQVRLETVSKNELLAMREEAIEALAQGNLSQADTLLSQMAEEGMWNAAKSYLELAQLYSVQERFQEADNAYKTAIALTKELNGDGREKEMQALESYAKFLRAHGSIQDAETAE